MPRASMSRCLLLVALAATPLPGTADVIGEVERLEVWAYGTPPDGARGDLFRGNDVESGELVETVTTGQLMIRFLDGTTLGMGGDSALVLDELVFDPNAPDIMAIELTSGFFHFVTGDIEKEAVIITTPAMVIGVRGTDLAISVGDDGSTELGVRDGIATATPAAGGDTVDVATGSTASAQVGDTEIGLSQGLSAAARGPMPGSDAGSGEGGGDRDETPETERGRSEPNDGDTGGDSDNSNNLD